MLHLGDTVAAGCGESGDRGSAESKIAAWEIGVCANRYSFGLMLLALCIAPGGALAGVSECKNAAETVDTSISEISSTLRRYSTCVSDSQGQDDCSSEFRRLKSAQSDFEFAVSSYQSECR